MRITKAALYAQAASLNEALGRPEQMFASKVGEHPIRFNEGHIALDKNLTGYQLEEQTGDAGGVVTLTARLTGAEISLFMQGMMRGARLQREANVSAR
jgi:hypothetical protein